MAFLQERPGLCALLRKTVPGLSLQLWLCLKKPQSKGKGSDSILELCVGICPESLKVEFNVGPQEVGKQPLPSGFCRDD